MKELLQERLYNLMVARGLETNQVRRDALSAEIRKIQSILEGM